MYWTIAQPSVRSWLLVEDQRRDVRLLAHLGELPTVLGPLVLREVDRVELERDAGLAQRVVRRDQTAPAPK